MEPLVPDTVQPVDLAQHDLSLRLLARAHHEAAHAVVATLLGAQVSAVEIWSGPPVTGRVELAGLDDPSPGSADHGLVRRLAYALAGPLGEQIARDGPGAILHEAASQAAAGLMAAFRHPACVELVADLSVAADLLRGHFGPDGEAAAAAAMDHLALGVETCLREHWLAIQSVALGLLRHGRLAGDDLKVTLSAALPTAPAPDALPLPTTLRGSTPP